MVTTETREQTVALYRPPLSASMSLEDVVKHYASDEKRRKRGDDSGDAKQRHVSAMITELASSVKVVAARSGVSQTILTRCMARHSLCWYTEVLRLDELSNEYMVVFLEAKKGHTVIRKQMQQINFESLVPYEPGDSWWDVPNFVSLIHNEWREPMSAETYTLLMYGIAWSLTTLRHQEWDGYNIETYFLPEVRHFEKMLAYRRIDLEAFQSKLRVDDGLTPKR